MVNEQASGYSLSGTSVSGFKINGVVGAEVSCSIQDRVELNSLFLQPLDHKI